MKAFHNAPEKRALSVTVMSDVGSADVRPLNRRNRGETADLSHDPEPPPRLAAAPPLSPTRPLPHRVVTAEQELPTRSCWSRAPRRRQTPASGAGGGGFA